ncbi:hypothetical protein [Mycobacterium ostraviense]|uniref:Uncharacterized protein n=1 Tax=Mycobacterium ostraviense TaxID=2738409 RepID=A0A164EPT1_9MYCO|nr:hypothetical protein [Mycobacterium ostraviense]KZS67814.1 hypothetical protein A4G28_26980 [Mycobacterium ostraviense]UGT91055.1 hypothetical protein LTS72_23015 [Mycobacterium ostraviense]
MNTNGFDEAIHNSGRIMAGAPNSDSGTLFDPVWSPAMWERANSAMRDLRQAMTEARVRYDSHDYDRPGGKFDIDNPPDDAVFIWSVGSRTVLVCCRAGASEIDRRLRGPDYFSGMLQLFADIDNYHRYNSNADDELRRTINLADNCTASAPVFSGGTTRLLLLLRRDPTILLWRVCRACETLARETAENNFKFGVISAQAQLPPGARIDPRSPVRPTP